MSKRVGLLFFTLVFAVLVACNKSDDAGNFSANENKKRTFSSDKIIEVSSSNSDTALSSSSQSMETLSSSVKASSKVKIKYGFIKDRCDGRKYKTMTIDGQTWMAQNLNFKTPYSECFDDADKRSCAKYGRRYDWEESLEICPAGWHLPSKDEWDWLISRLGGNEAAGKFFRKASGWDSGELFRFWSSTEYYGERFLKAESFVLDDRELYHVSRYKSALKSVRCVLDRRERKDERREGDGNKGVEESLKVKISGNNTTVRKQRRIMGTMTDTRNGKSYKTVKIGKQTWMAQNLNYKMDDSFCYDDRAVNCAKYGSLYEWADAMNACPAGWRLPTKAEWDTLISNAGGNLLAGKMLKSKQGWKSLKGKNFGNGTDAFGFSALPSGYFSRGFEKKDHKAYFWSSSKAPSNYGTRFFYLDLGGDYDDNKYERQERYFNRCDLKPEHDYSLPEEYERAVLSGMNHDNKLSVRCVKDDVGQKYGPSALQTNGERRENDAETISSSSEMLFVASFVPPSDVVKGTFKDKRDGRKYKSVTIGNQTWMAENLKFKSAKSSCFDNADSNCVKFGHLYPWNDAVKACPAGWRLPMNADWDTLIASVGGKSLAGKMLKVTKGWLGSEMKGDFWYRVSENGSDDYGFSVIPVFYDESALFWNYTEYSIYESYMVNLSAHDDEVKLNVDYKHKKYSIRCIKEERKSKDGSGIVIPTVACPECTERVPGLDSSRRVTLNSATLSSWRGETPIGSITDTRDGQTYKTVQIGEQTWMAENLNYKADSSYCYDDSVENCSKYGRLYTWNAVKDACPTGFHLPTQLEWDDLFLAVGGRFKASETLRSKEGWKPTRWYQWSDNGSDDFGFTALPAGYWDSTYRDKDDKAYFWSSSMGDYEYYGEKECPDVYKYHQMGASCRLRSRESWLHGRSVYLRDTAFYWTYDEEYRNQAYSIRCVKDMEKRVTPGIIPRPDSSHRVPLNSATLSSWRGETPIGSITDSRDGQSYKTVKIGKQTWMAENLKFSVANSFCFHDSPENCENYGRLYSGTVAKDVCLAGWHLPKLSEWMTLIYAVGDTLTAGNRLKSSSGWKDLRGTDFGNGTDDYGFSALPGGFINGSACDLGHKAYFWGYTNDDKMYSIKFGGSYDDLGCELQKEKEEKNRYPASKMLQWHRYDSHNIDVLQNENLCLPKNYNSVVWEYKSEDAKLSVRCVKDE